MYADEYIAFNYFDKESEDKPSYCHTVDDHDGDIACVEEKYRNNTRVRSMSFFNHSFDEYVASINNGSHFRAKLNQSSTMAEHIDKQYDVAFNNFHCIVLARYPFISKESDKRVIEDGVETGFNATLFHTLRYRYR